jgi:anti-sigma B factor antagonist
VELCLKAQSEGEIPVLHCRGRIVFREEASALSDKAYELLQRHQRLLLDLSGVDNIDSGGLGALVMLQMWATQGGCELKFCSPTRRVLKLLELTNLHSIFELHPTRDEALGAFSEPAAL